MKLFKYLLYKTSKLTSRKASGNEHTAPVAAGRISIAYLSNISIITTVTIIACFILFLVNSKAYSQVFSFEANSDTGTAILPRGTMIKAVLQQTVSTKDNKLDDMVSFVTSSDMTIGKAVCIPKGSVLSGKIIRLEHAKPGRDGYFQIFINKIVFPDGWRTDTNATIWTRDGTGIIGGGLTQRQKFKKITHYISGIGPIDQLVRTGPRVMGQERAMLAENDTIIVLESDLHIKYLKKLE